MIRIIDPKPSPQVVKEVVCGNCGVRLEYVPDDVKTINGRDYSGGPDGHDFIVCPSCIKKVILRSW